MTLWLWQRGWDGQREEVWGGEGKRDGQTDRHRHRLRHTDTQTQTSRQTHTYMYRHTQIDRQTHTHTHMHTQIDRHIHTYTCTHTYTYTHIRSVVPLPFSSLSITSGGTAGPRYSAAAACAGGNAHRHGHLPSRRARPQQPRVPPCHSVFTAAQSGANKLPAGAGVPDLHVGLRTRRGGHDPAVPAHLSHGVRREMAGAQANLPNLPHTNRRTARPRRWQRHLRVATPEHRLFLSQFFFLFSRVCANPRAHMSPPF